MLNAIEIGNRIKEKQKEKNFKQKDIIEKIRAFPRLLLVIILAVHVCLIQNQL